jgi:ferric-dicitrate binding protein FerR (iron transport regulator)
MTTRAGGVTVSPASNALTEFEVTDLNGTVQIVARKGDVSVSDGSQTSTLAQGEQTTRDETQGDQSKKRKRRGGAAAPAAGGGVLDSPVAIGVGTAAVGGLVTWVLLQGDEPASPSKP